MNRLRLFLLLQLLLWLLSLLSCERAVTGQADGCIRLRFAEVLGTKTSAQLPDTNDFLLSVRSGDGAVLYDGKYGDSPEEIMAAPGTYSVSVRSEDFSAPAFDSPVYGDEEVAVIVSGQVTEVLLECRQVNSGLRLRLGSDFLSAYPDGALTMRSDAGKLPWAYGESRIAYFEPGAVSVAMSVDGTDRVLFTKDLKAQEVLTVGISVPSSSGATGGVVSVIVDTSRVWTDADYDMGGGSGKGSSVDEALSVSQARSSAGLEYVWVAGYVVGGDLTSAAKGISFEAPFSSRTHLAIASRSSVSAKSSCIAVELKKGTVRDALNLVDNQGLLGKRVALRGDIVQSYYGIVGLKNVTEYQLYE